MKFNKITVRNRKNLVHETKWLKEKKTSPESHKKRLFHPKYAQSPSSLAFSPLLFLYYTEKSTLFFCFLLLRLKQALPFSYSPQVHLLPSTRNTTEQRERLWRECFLELPVSALHFLRSQLSVLISTHICAQSCWQKTRIFKRQETRKPSFWEEKELFSKRIIPFQFELSNLRAEPKIEISLLWMKLSRLMS